MTDKEKLEKLKKLADAMYYAAQYLTTDASRLHKAMDEYHQFIIHEYHKEEPTIPDIVDEHWWEMLGEELVSEDLKEEITRYFSKNPIKHLTDWPALKNTALHFANWQKQRDNIPQELVDAFWEFQKVGGDAVRDFINAVNGYNSNKSISKDLEKAAITAADEDMQGRQIMEESNENRQLYSRIFRRGFKAGANWQKQQIMKEAVEGTARPDDNEIWCNLASSNLKDGDKVKVIVIKED